jgi:hypothetical protein
LEARFDFWKPVAIRLSIQIAERMLWGDGIA